MDKANLSNWKKSPVLALTALLAVTAVWGSTFILVKNAITHIPVMDFLAIRFLLAALIMIAIRPFCLRKFNRQGILRGILLGFFLGGAYIAQTFGLIWASATVSGFITGTFVIFTPFVYWLVMHQKPKWTTWAAVLLASTGLGLLGLHGWAIGRGELLTLLCAIFIAIHIVGLGAWAPHHDAYGLAFIQISTVAIISLAAAVPEGINMAFSSEVWLALGITAIFATAFAFIIQTWTQSIVAPTLAAVVLTMEPVFAGIFGIAFGGDPVTFRIILGAASVLGAMLLVQLTQKQQEPEMPAKIKP
jgi:drug/metabolite transporter (DMT)-like permease